MGLVGVGVGNAAVIQIAFWLDVPPLSLRKIVVYCMLMAAGYVAGGMVIAKYWGVSNPIFHVRALPGDLVRYNAVRPTCGWS